MLRRILPWTLALVTALSLPSSAHDVVEASDFETLLITDELDDAPYVYGGYDLGDVYFAEVHLPEHGDGLYFHVQLFGPYKPGTGEWSVRFTFTTPAGAVVRTVTTQDGEAFDSDFTDLRFRQSDESTNLERAFLAYEPGRFERGTTLSGFTVESFVGADLRDRAPGGLYFPGSGGQIEMFCTVPPPPRPCESQVEVPELTLEGPNKFVQVQAKAAQTGFDLEIKNLLPKNGQHVHIDTGGLSREGRAGGWRGDVSQGTTELKGGGTWKVDLDVEPVPGPDGAVEPLFLNVTSDVGGRVPLTVRLLEGRPALSVLDAEPVAMDGPVEPQGAAPGAPLLALLGAALLALRRSR